MSFQSSVSLAQGFGVPGEQFADGPWRVQSFVLDSDDAAYNIIGATMCTITSQGVCQAGSGGGLGFAGLLVDPKNIALFGAGGIPLAPTLSVPNFTQVECATMGSYVVTLPGAANIGDLVIFDNTTGAISTITPSTPLPSGKSFANAVVDYYTASGAGLAVITISSNLINPQPD
jgi:hypothetical protein